MKCVQSKPPEQVGNSVKCSGCSVLASNFALHFLLSIKIKFTRSSLFACVCKLIVLHSFFFLFICCTVKHKTKTNSRQILFTSSPLSLAYCQTVSRHIGHLWFYLLVLCIVFRCAQTFAQSLNRLGCCGFYK